MSIHEILRRSVSVDVALRMMTRHGFELSGGWYVRGGERLTRQHIEALHRVYRRVAEKGAAR